MSELPILERRLGNRLREARMDAGLTQAALAMELGVSRKTINTVENGVFVPSVLLALGLAETLRASVDELFFIDRRNDAGVARG
ncbi:putative transcriptional regulator [Endobacter medicaginis]|uniref:Helix-turn-helix transcriptional regulator n=1 Tax=Endobacter medicaginis TaxID=1181271 RepID=A0A850NMM3_9PROT|nr:helix-turn-helix transcriptional regulator [Endobacter medicaginis]MBB3174497.1 putative transcriptional regulator [Endobacter medicaginis]MCX5475054.1 helix-turn-helix transcriptional regulator [Endobacter medicaginis]NVN30174.1 helix-turn-helix transcriptional regulator [Endobacter medicaginis]